MSAIDKEPFPRGALIAAGALIFASLVAASYGRYQNLNAPPQTAAMRGPVQDQVDMRFFDAPDGTVTIREARTERVVAILVPGEDAFIRTVMRGFTRARKIRGIGSDVPFELIRYETGKLELADPTTGKRIDLRAFGPTNRDAFARLLPGKAPADAGPVEPSSR
jgi:putative photosynthetic complex assembly protein